MFEKSTEKLEQASAIESIVDINEERFHEDVQPFLDSIDSPAYVFDERHLEHNLSILEDIQTRTGCKIILALKAFASTCCFPMIRQSLQGATASSLNEAKLCRDYFGKEVHVYSPAYKQSEFPEIQSIADHIVFNSFSQWKRFKDEVRPGVKCGIRVNPQYSEVKTDIYNPCLKNSRFGVKEEDFQDNDLTGISGMHLHALCEQNADVLERVWRKAEAKFGRYLQHFDWINLGGGHLVTDEDYDVEKLIALINHIQSTYDVQVILEPGEAVVLNMGYLVSSVVDIVFNGSAIAIVDTSASAHMPDVMEMPYVPEIIDAGAADEYPNRYQIGGVTCLSGDVMGDYSFEDPLTVGDKLIFADMAHYTIVQNTTFNGIASPSIYLMKKNGNLEKIREFNYGDFVKRLG